MDFNKMKKRRKFKRSLFIILPILLVTLTVGAYSLYLHEKMDRAMTKSYDNFDRDKSELRDDYVDPKFNNVSILLMGIDSSDKRGADDIARTDALLLATLNKDQKSVKLLSIPRDAYMYIPEVGYETKVNHAHAYGGPYATIGAIEEKLNIPIDYYLRINFEAFMDVVDALDGVTVDVPYEFTEQNSRDKAGAIHLLPGYQRLNGEEALALARTRKKDTDVMRGQRQQQIVEALAQKALKVQSVTKYDDVIDAIGENLKTNMTFPEMKSFIGYLTQGKSLKIESLNVDGYDYQPGGTYFWQFDERSLAKTVNELEYHLELSLTDFGYEYTTEEWNDIYDREGTGLAEDSKTDGELPPTDDTESNDIPQS